jgi:DNA uptake protein ComE-like DNA-binding protein
MQKLRTITLALIIALTFGTIAFAADNSAKIIDINTATVAQLKTIPGVGDETAKKIIDGRPYYKKSELNTKKVISTDLYEKINKLISAVC